MKYTINSKTIDIEYIADSKRKKLKLNNDDSIDMDFFNQLIAAKPNKRDAMCELYRRKILKESDDDIVHITPLKLDKELKPSKYAEKEELKRRREELERDKNGIKNEIDNLLKIDSKNKDIKSLDKSDLNNVADEPQLKELQRKYIEIDKIHQMIVNQIDSLEINTADSVNIKELKNLTVNAFDIINKSLIEAKITEQDKEDIANKISNVVVPRFNNLKSLIKQLKQKINEIDTTSKEQFDDFKLQYTRDFMDFIKAIEESISTLPLTNDIKQIKELVEDLQDDVDNIPEIEKKLDKLNEKLENLPDVYNEQTIQKREITLNELVDALKQNQDILEQNISEDLIKSIKSELPSINPNITFKEFKKSIFEGHDQGSTQWEGHKPDTLKDYNDMAFWNDNYLYVINKTELPIEPEIIDITSDKKLNFYRYSFDDIKKLTVGNLIKHTTLNSKKNVLINHKPNIYISIYIGYYKLTMTEKKKYVHIPVFELTDGNKEFIELLKAIQKNEPKSEGLNNNGGKIMIDLNKSTTDEKLNEIIRLLSQMNYNIFTQTPMYKNNKYKKQEQKKSKGIDLYDVLNL